MLSSRNMYAGCAGLIAAGVVGGCATLDPAADIDHAASIVTARAGSQTGWTSPWNEPIGQWDGRAPLSSDTAVRAALQNNRLIRRQVEQIVATRADYVQAHLLPNPVINIALGFPTDGMGGEPLAVSLVQQLAWLWRRPVAIDEAHTTLRAQVLTVSDAALTLVADVRTAHANVHFAEQALDLQNENVALLRQSLDLLNERFDVGEASGLDVNRTELVLRAAEVGRIDRSERLDVARRALLELIGRANAGAQWTTVAPDPIELERAMILDEAQLMDIATTQRLDVAAAQATAEARAAGVNLHERGRLPDISAGVGFQQNFNNRPGVFPSVGITPKVFDDNRARIAGAESAWHQAVIEADRVRETAIGETRAAWIRLTAQRQAAAAYRDEIILLARRNLDLAQDSFQAGETDLTVLLEAQQRLNSARIELADRARAAATQLFELERAVGGSLSPPTITMAEDVR